MGRCGSIRRKSCASDVTTVCPAEQDAAQPRRALVQVDDRDLCDGQQVGHACLTPPITPHLRHDARWHRELEAVLDRFPEESRDASVAPFNGDQRAGVKGETDDGHVNPSTASAQARTSGAGGPDSASHSSSSDVRSPPRR
jgi:hypothetical protein